MSWPASQTTSLLPSFNSAVIDSEMSPKAQLDQLALVKFECFLHQCSQRVRQILPVPISSTA
ncbi:MAG: hypothetical protein OJF51_001760 [Nitrospira sp.]|nr:MAG: hypothetical protein OJF51_001760 [Nitrospira sp.]